MRFEARVFRLAKDPLCAEENQDAFRLDAVRGIAAIADGVTASIFAGAWARILTEAVAAGPPNPADPAVLTAWLAPLREQWAAAIDPARLQWYQRAKMRQGAFSTLLWAEFVSPDDSAAGPCLLRCHAIGDSCLLHIRANQVLRSFPLEHPEQFQADPLVVGSIDLRRDELLQFTVMEETCAPDDLVALCTDAVAEWILRQLAAGDPPDWQAWWQLTEEAWQDDILRLRQLREIRHDDSTLILLRPNAVPAAAGAPKEQLIGTQLPALEEAPQQPSSPATLQTPDEACAAGAGNTEPSPLTPLPKGEGTKTPSPPAPLPTKLRSVPGEGRELPSAPAPVPQAPPVQPAVGPRSGDESSLDSPALQRAKELLAASEEVAEKVAEQLRHGMQKAEKFLRKYRGKYPPRKDEQ